MNQLISVVVPVYNAEKYVARCIESILHQAYQNFELILINDGSSDNSKSICEHYKSKDKRIVVHHQLNAGVSAARNKGIELSQGEYICFVDSDDWIDIDYLTTFFSFNIDYQNTIVLQDILRVKKEQTIVNCNFDNVLIEKNNFHQLLLKYQLFRFGYPFSKLYNAAKIKKNHIKFNTKIHFSEDLLFLLEYLQYVDHVQLSNKASYNYIDVGESLSYAYHSFESEYECFKEMIKLTNSLQIKFKNIDKGYLNKSIGHFLSRSINSLYRPKSKKEKKERLEILKSLYSANNLNYLYAWNKNNTLQKVGLFLYKQKMFLLCDFYYQSIFFLRYSLNKTWIKYRRYIVKYLK